MKRLTALVAVAALILGSASAFAQAKPNFAGKWMLEPAPEAAAAPAGGGGGRGGGRGGGLGMELTITQDASMIKLDYMGGGRNPGPVSLTYKLDGSESMNTMGANEQTAKAMWEGNKLSVATTMANGEQKRTFSMEGGNLVIETMNPGRQGGEPTMTRAVYKKGM